MNRFLYLVLCTVAVLFPKATVASSSIDSLIINKWKYYTQVGSYDSLVITAKPIYEEAVLDEDWDIALHSSIMIAQAYLFTEDADSVYRWLDIAESLGVENAGLSLKSVFYNVKAIFAVKMKLDYSEALQYFLKGLETATALGNDSYKVVILTNIANVFI